MIKFILTFLVIIFFIRLVAPFLFRWLLAVFVKKSIRNGTFFSSTVNGQQRPQQTNGSSPKKAAGDINIDYIPEQPERKNFDGGQYVDYEEVK